LAKVIKKIFYHSCRVNIVKKSWILSHHLLQCS